VTVWLPLQAACQADSAANATQDKRLTSDVHKSASADKQNNNHIKVSWCLNMPVLVSTAFLLLWRTV